MEVGICACHVPFFFVFFLLRKLTFNNYVGNPIYFLALFARADPGRG